jgi:hypothetical protein
MVLSKSHHRRLVNKEEISHGLTRETWKWCLDLREGSPLEKGIVSHSKSRRIEGCWKVAGMTGQVASKERERAIADEEITENRKGSH